MSWNLNIDKELADALIQLWKNDDLEIVESGEWTQDHKYQIREVIVKYDDRFFAIHESRSGSYHSDWEYDDPHVGGEVKPVEIKKIDWVLK